jgi:hypothetical protein
MLFKSTSATEYLEPQWYEQAVGTIEAYNILGADAATPGANDFALGVKKFLALTEQAKFPWISANLYRKDSGERFLPDSILIDRYGKKIGIFGLFHPSLPLPAELEARDPIAHAREAVAKLRGQGAEMVIALAHEGYDEDVKLARAVKGIDLIVGSHSQSLLQSPDKEGETLIVQLSSQGQMLGMVEYEAKDLPAKRTDFVVAELNNEFDAAPKGLANPMKSLVAVTNLRMKEANRKLDERIWAAHEGRNVGFQTFLSCRDCHGKQANFQEGKRHAAAFLTLVAKKQETNLDCVKCHSVGLGAPGGFKSLNGAFVDAGGHPIDWEHLSGELAKAGAHPEPGVNYRANPALIRPHVAKWIQGLKDQGVKKAFVSVQCENCHGARPDHPFGNTEKATKVAAGLCLQCHTQAQMPAWYDGAGKVKNATVQAAIKSVACPR